MIRYCTVPYHTVRNRYHGTVPYPTYPGKARTYVYRNFMALLVPKVPCCFSTAVDPVLVFATKPYTNFQNKKKSQIFKLPRSIMVRVSDPYSFFTDPDPDPVDPDGCQYGSG